MFSFDADFICNINLFNYDLIIFKLYDVIVQYDFRRRIFYF